MHTGAFQWVEQHVLMLPKRTSVLEIGSKNINGSIRSVFGRIPYWGIDWQDGPDVDEVADGGKWRSDRKFDTVICMECLEHAPNGKEICQTAFEQLTPGGVFITTSAGIGRPPHSAVDGGLQLRGGEWYCNIQRSDLEEWLQPFMLNLIDDRCHPCDIYSLSVKAK